MLDNYPSDEDLKEEGFVSRDWFKDYDDYALKWHYAIPQSTATDFSAYKINRLGAKSRFYIFVCAERDGVKKREICLFINSERQKDKGLLFTKNLTLDSVMERFKDWTKDASSEWKINAEKGLGHLFRSQLRSYDIETETEIESGVDKGITAKVRHKKKKSLKRIDK